jgi:PTS system mannose-specific IIB component/fructoselysine and glucoselysine-specific PTS system IIB component
MPISLYRVDERLIHGQVVVGWGGQLRPGRYIVVDALVASSEWEQELYSLGVPSGVEAEFVSPADARGFLDQWRASELKSVLLTRDLETMAELARGGRMEGVDVNLGGLHSQANRKEVLPYLFLDDEDLELLRELEAEGVVVSAQDLPGSQRVPLSALLR